MSKFQLTWLRWWFLALALTAAAWAQPTAPGQIRLMRVVGQVAVETKATGAQRTVANGDEIGQGSLVRTAGESSVVLVFSNGATVSLGPDAVLDIEEFVQDPFREAVRPTELTREPSTSRTKLRLSQGELVGNVKTLNREGGSSFTVQTPAGAAGIRGTTFRVIFVSDGAGGAIFSVTTIEGEVGVWTGAAGAVGDPQAVVGENQEVSVDVSIDPATGEVTILTPLADLAPQAASPAEIAEVAAAMQQLVEAVADFVIPPPTDSPGETTTEEGAAPPTEPVSTLPPVLGRSNSDPTVGDGRPSD